MQVVRSAANVFLGWAVSAGAQCLSWLGIAPASSCAERTLLCCPAQLCARWQAVEDGGAGTAGRNRPHSSQAEQVRSTSKRTQQLRCIAAGQSLRLVCLQHSNFGICRWLLSADALALAQGPTSQALRQVLSTRFASLVGQPAEVHVASGLADQGLGKLTDWFDVFRICQVCIQVLCMVARG